MKNFFTKGRIALLAMFSILTIDQVIKVIVKIHMYWHESIRIIDWFCIYFAKNSDTAFGLEIFGKLFFASLRIAAVRVIGWFLCKSVEHGMKTGFTVCVLFILAGALDNIIDSVSYRVLFNESTHSQLATFTPEGGGYALLLYGKVVDTFHFPIIETNWPMRMPFIGGKHFVFFSPIFNFADAVINYGTMALLLLYSKYLNDSYHAIKKS